MLARSRGLTAESVITPNFDEKLKPPTSSFFNSIVTDEIRPGLYPLLHTINSSIIKFGYTQAQELTQRGAEKCSRTGNDRGGADYLVKYASGWPTCYYHVVS